MRLLLNASGDPGPGPLDDAGLAALYRHPEPGDGRPWVRANFVTTLDGAVQGEDGRSGTINTAADRAVFQLMRALSDVVLVGAGTARTEGYRAATTDRRWRETRRAAGHRTPHPAMAVVTRSGDVPPLLSESHEDVGEVYLLTCGRAPEEAVDLARETLGEDRVVVTGSDSVDLPDALARLAGLGLGRVLCEGGPHPTHDLVGCGSLDELCLTLSPRLIAGERLGVLAGPELHAELVPWSLIEADATVIGRWVRSDRTGAAASA